MKGYALLALGCWAGLGLAAEGHVAVEFAPPRPFGYVIGDAITHHAAVAVDAPYQLSADALPKPGPVNRWLWLRGVDVAQSADGPRRHYRVTLRYQTFYAPLAVKNLTIPGLDLVFASPTGTVKAPLPAWTFSTAPLRGLAAAEDDGHIALRPDAEPQPLPTWPYWARLAGWAGLASAALAYLGYSLGWLGVGGRGRHFAEALRALRRLEGTGPAPIQAAFAQVHQGFNQTLGAALFIEGLADFFQAHPSYQPLRGEIEAFFQASYALFFGGQAQADAFPLRRLQRLCRDCIRIEREAA